MYLSQRRGGVGGGGDRDTNTTFHLPFASKIKFSSRVHLLNKIGKKNTSNGKQNYFNAWIF